jgi:hypothetical protein
VLIRAGNDVGAAPIADYHDDLVVNSNTLAVGTAVTLQFVETLISTTASTGISGGNSFGTAQVDGFYNIQDIHNGVAPISGSFSGNPQSGNGILAPDANNTTPGMDKTIIVDVQADVGDEVQFQNLLYAFGEADSADGTGDNSFSYSGTYDTTISMLTPDASFTTQSGALYSASISAVPEPTTWTMLLLGLFGIGLISRGARRKNPVAVACSHAP